MFVVKLSESCDKTVKCLKPQKYVDKENFQTILLIFWIWNYELTNQIVFFSQMGPNANSTNATPFSFLCQNLGWSNYLESRPQPQQWRDQQPTQPSLPCHNTGQVVFTLQSPLPLHQHYNGAFWARLNNKGGAEAGQDRGEFTDDKQIWISASNGLYGKQEVEMLWTRRIILPNKQVLLSS